MQTIHAFCTRLLHQFPFEANVAARFTVLDEASTAQLLDKLTLAVLLEASAKPDGALGQALATAIVEAADQTFKDVIGDAIKRARRHRRLDQARRQRRQGDRRTIDGRSASMRMTRRKSIEREFLSHSLIPAAEWPALIEILASGSKSDANHVAALRAAQAAAGRERIDNYLKVFCTAELAPRKNIVTKKIADQSSRLA